MNDCKWKLIRSVSEYTFTNIQYCNANDMSIKVYSAASSIAGLRLKRKLQKTQLNPFCICDP